MRATTLYLMAIFFRNEFGFDWEASSGIAEESLQTFADHLPPGQREKTYKVIANEATVEIQNSLLNKKSRL